MIEIDTKVNSLGNFGISVNNDSKEPYSVLLFYKFAKVSDPKKLCEDHREFCEKHNILGRIIIAKEGINATMSGRIDDIREYKNWLITVKGFEDTWFKEQVVEKHLFPKLSCKVRDELVTMRAGDIDITKTAPHVTPTQLNEMIEKGEVILFDGRNEIESRIGKFKNAITPMAGTFRDFITLLKDYDHLKDKKIVTYCTGGIRCEKLTVIMKDMGFKDVYQLDGGIYNYCNQYPNGHFEGTCFVFDDRLQVAWKDGSKLLNEEELDSKAISHCEFCNKKTSRVIDDERFLNRVMRVCCSDCDKKLDISRLRTKEERLDIVNQAKL